MMAAPRRADTLGIFGQRTITDDRVLGIGVNVEHRSVVERDPDGSEFRRQGRRKPRGELYVTASAKDRHRRPFGEWRLQSRDPPAFLIDAHPERQIRREPLHVNRHLGDLLRRLDVASEQNHATERELFSQRTNLGGDRRAREDCRSEADRCRGERCWARKHYRTVCSQFRDPGSRLGFFVLGSDLPSIGVL